MDRQFGEESQIATPTTRVVIADVNDVICAALKDIVASESGFTVVGLALTGDELVTLCRTVQPDLVLTTLRMPDPDGLTAIREVKRSQPTTAITIVTACQSFPCFFEAMQAGATSYLLMDDLPGGLVDAIHHARLHEPYLSPRMFPHLVRFVAHGGRERGKSQSAIRLTSRERDILGLMAEGKSNREIADRIMVTEGTVKSHISNILAKLNVSNRTQAVVSAITLGLVTSASTIKDGVQAPLARRNIRLTSSDFRDQVRK